MKKRPKSPFYPGRSFPGSTVKWRTAFAYVKRNRPVDANALLFAVHQKYAEISVYIVDS